MKLQHFLWVFLISLVAVLISIIYAAWLIFGPVKTLEIKDFALDSPLHVETPVVHPGDKLVYHLSYCKFIDRAGVVHRTLIDGQVITLVDKMGNAPLGCRDTDVSSTVIPETIRPGKYYLDVAVDYQVNALRSERIHYFTEYFQVVGMDVPSTSTPPEDSGHDTPSGDAIMRP